MKRNTLPLAAALYGLAASAGWALQPIGQVISLEGSAFADQESGLTVPLVVQTAIHANDCIRTEAASKIQIMLADEAIIMVGENSEMVMDSFVYTPAVKEENETTMSLLHGIFRVITAKVTDLNPERFKVKTNMASIGIRGCELAFEVEDDSEAIQIVRVPEGKTIYLQNLQIEGNELIVSQQGVQVLAEEGARFKKRALKAEDILRLRQATTPVVAALEPSDSPAGSRTAFRSPGSEVAEGSDMADSDVRVEDQFARFGALEAADEADDLIRNGSLHSRGLTSPSVDPVVPDSPVAVLPEVAGIPSPVSTESMEVAMVDPKSAGDVSVAPSEPAPPSVPGAPSVPAPVDPSPNPSTPPGDGSGLQLLLDIIDALIPDPPTPEPPATEYPIIGSQVSAGSGAGTDWSWGAWAREDILGEDGGVPQTRTAYGTTVSGSVLSAPEFQSIAAGGLPRVLTGIGDAVAGLNSDTQGALLTGSSDVRLVLGGNVTPAWQGTFNLGGGGNSLNFQANGVLDGGGSLNTSASTYSLTAFGQGYNASSLTQNQVTGSLVGSGGGVTGNIGAFNFDHGAAGVRVQGVYGTDLH